MTLPLYEKPVIVAVDDDPAILNTLASVLKANYCIKPFVSGKMALSYLFSHDADIVLLDYQMPEMSGFDVLRVLQSDERLREIPTLFLTSTIGSESEVEALEQGAADYITKPVNPRVLLTRIRLQLELQKYRKQLEALVDERTKNLNETYEKLKAREDVTLSMLAKATDLRDSDTGGHIERTTEFVRIIVQDILNFPKPGYTLTQFAADDIIRSSKLHDLGKIAMPDNILLKRARLTSEEFDVIKTHPAVGEQFLSSFIRRMNDSFLLIAKDIAYCHHERWDGTGYPLGLSGSEIPLSARIVTIADVYDSLRSVRPYKGKLTHEVAVEKMREGSGKLFDPYLIDIFLLHADEFKEISENTEAYALSRPITKSGVISY